MNRAATTNPSQMSKIFLSLPQYHFYRHHPTALKNERIFRLSLGQMLQDVAERLLHASETRSDTMNRGQHQRLQEAVEDIGTLITHLNRRGTIKLAGSPVETIVELRELDNKLIMLLEQTWHMAAAVLSPDCGTDRFEEGSHYLSLMLQAFAETAEERNQRLGLGWESEFGMSPMPERE